MALPRALPRSEAKSKLLKHLDMPEQVYARLASEADVVYRELVGDRRNLKPSQWNASPPYDWNHICERSREDAVNKLAAGGDNYTSYYWHKGSAPLQTGLPWLPVWFLYKIFRHRDGRARSSKSSSLPAQNASYSTRGNNAYDASFDFTNTVNMASVNGGTSSTMQDPAYVASKNESSTRGFYDPVREEYIER